MGLRRNILVAIAACVDGLVVNNRTITVSKSLFNLDDIHQSKLPKFCCVPAPENVNVQMGTMCDSDYRIALIGAAGKDADGDLFGMAEDIIDAIVGELTDEASALSFCAIGFSVVGIGPITREQMEMMEGADRVYISIPIAIQFST
jgi:hypothetical protein